MFKDLLKKLQEAVKQVTVKNDLTGEFVQLLTKEILSLDLELLVKVKAAKDVAGNISLCLLKSLFFQFFIIIIIIILLF